MNKVFVIHFQPLEKYPPVMNLLRYLAKKKGNIEIHTLTTRPASHALFSLTEVFLHRLARWHQKMTGLRKLYLYLGFNLTALWLLIRYRPGKVLYFETMSAWPAVVYKKYLNRSSELFIHYHEYTSPEEYRHGPFLSRWLHRCERTILKSATWVSHTNEDRLRLFIRDIREQAPVNTAVLENLPPESWVKLNGNPAAISKDRFAFVYVGALSTGTMFVKEWSLFLRDYPEKFTWDIYSDNYSSDALKWIDSLKAKNIHFKGAVVYDDLPDVLKNYDVGLVLYKGHIPNYIFNAPNKLFEYHACGLDVWFPETMIGSLPYVTHGTFPKIVPVNFENLNIQSVDEALQRAGFSYQPSSYYYEKRLPAITDLLLSVHR